MDLNIYNVNRSDDYEIVKDSVQRGWMDDTTQKHGYMCLPVTSMNTHSWSVILKKKTVFHWSEDSDGEDVGVLTGPGYYNTHGGFISFQLPFIFETPKDFYTVFFPNPNFLYKNVTPLSFLIRSDWFPSTFQCAWKLHEPGRYVIEEGTPLISFMPYPKSLIDDVSINVYNGESIKDSVWHKRHLYSQRVESEYDKIDRSSFKEYPYIYKSAKLRDDMDPLVEDASWRPRLKNPESFT